MNRKTEKINIPVKEDTSAQYIYNRTILNWNNVRYWIKVFKIQHREIVCAQIIQECGWNLDSKRAIQNGNILGLKKAYNRLTTADYIRDGHSGYSSFIRCLKDYQLFQEANYKAGSYYEFLEKIHYAEDSTYTQKLRSIVRKIECRCKNSE
jgi:flagellum-specific peptidoglycan hydrolase FlgJ